MVATAAGQRSHEDVARGDLGLAAAFTVDQELSVGELGAIQIIDAEQRVVFGSMRVREQLPAHTFPGGLDILFEGRDGLAEGLLGLIRLVLELGHECGGKLQDAVIPGRHGAHHDIACPQPHDPGVGCARVGHGRSRPGAIADVGEPENQVRFERNRAPGKKTRAAQRFQQADRIGKVTEGLRGRGEALHELPLDRVAGSAYEIEPALEICMCRECVAESLRGGGTFLIEAGELQPARVLCRCRADALLERGDLNGIRAMRFQQPEDVRDSPGRECWCLRDGGRGQQQRSRAEQEHRQTDPQAHPPSR